jgi:membrane protease YdiL (CAAX protease family)
MITSIFNEYPLRIAHKILLAEVLIFTVLVEIGLFLPEKARPKMGLALLTWIFFVEVVRRLLLRTRYDYLVPSLGGTGFRVKKFFDGFWLMGLVFHVGAIFLTVGYLYGTLHGTVWKLKLISYPLSAIAQECALQLYLLRRLLLVFRPTLAIGLASVVFCLCHIPNPVLMVFTLVAGVLFTAHFRRYRNIYLLFVAHLILGLCLSLAASKEFLKGMRVGGGYYHQIKVMRDEELLQFYNRLRVPDNIEYETPFNGPVTITTIEQIKTVRFLFAP